MSRTFSIRQATPEDETQWRRLLAEYGAESETTLSPDTVDRLWSWVLDSQHQTRCSVAADPQGGLIGFVHFRSFERALTASTGIHIEDVFVIVRARGGGVVDALLNHVFHQAAEAGSDLVTWMTSEDNYRARAAYDRHGETCDWVVYERAIDLLPALEQDSRSYK